MRPRTQVLFEISQRFITCIREPLAVTVVLIASDSYLAFVYRLRNVSVDVLPLVNVVGVQFDELHFIKIGGVRSDRLHMRSNLIRRCHNQLHFVNTVDL